MPGRLVCGSSLAVLVAVDRCNRHVSCCEVQFLCPPCPDYTSYNLNTESHAHNMHLHLFTLLFVPVGCGHLGAFPERSVLGLYHVCVCLCAVKTVTAI